MPRCQDTKMREGVQKIWRLNQEDAKMPRCQDARPIYCRPSSTCLFHVIYVILSIYALLLQISIYRIILLPQKTVAAEFLLTNIKSDDHQPLYDHERTAHQN